MQDVAFKVIRSMRSGNFNKPDPSIKFPTSFAAKESQQKTLLHFFHMLSSVIRLAPESIFRTFLMLISIFP